MISTSPLRYPGGKQVLTNVLSRVIRLNGLQGGVYAEPYAGGAGAALALLFGEHVDRIAINDADQCIYAMWRSILDDTDRFVSRIETCTVSVAAWRRHRTIYQSPTGRSKLDVGFATFFLNRCNRSGIIATGGPIGGIHQGGRWKIDARFNRETLIERVRKIAEYRARIELSNRDALAFLRRLERGSRPERTFVFLDPPYYEKGRALYLNYYDESDHRRLAQYLRGHVPFSWALTYDNVVAIQELYSDMRSTRFDLDYHARDRRVGKELFVVKNGLLLPPKWGNRIPTELISSSARSLAAA